MNEEDAEKNYLYNNLLRYDTTMSSNKQSETASISSEIASKNHFSHRQLLLQMNQDSSVQIALDSYTKREYDIMSKKTGKTIVDAKIMLTEGFGLNHILIDISILLILHTYIWCIHI